MHKEPYMKHAHIRKGPYIPAKKPHISAQEPYISANKPYISAKEPYTCIQHKVDSCIKIYVWRDIEISSQSHL